MPDVQYQTMTGAKQLAGLRQTALANATLHLFKDGFTPGINTPLADYQAAEADYTTYTAKTIATWNDPAVASVAGYNLVAPLQVFQLASTPVAANVIGGWFLVLADGTTLIDYGVFDPPRPMQLADQQVSILPTEFFPAGV